MVRREIQEIIIQVRFTDLPVSIPTQDNRKQNCGMLYSYLARYGYLTVLIHHAGNN